MTTKRLEALRAAIVTHDMSYSPEYKVWCAMIQRCCNAKNKYFHRYGGRGIFVCPEWRLSFEAFMRSVGNRPSPKHSLERINNSLGYSPDNCRWATAKEQQRNCRSNHLVTWQGQTKTIIEWAEELGLKYMTLHTRLRRNWPLEKAMRRNLDARGSYVKNVEAMAILKKARETASGGIGY